MADAQLQLNSIIAEYLRRRDNGEEVDEESLLRSFPHLREALQSYFEGEKIVGGLAATIEAEEEAGDLATAIPKLAQPASSADTIAPGNLKDTASQFRVRRFGRYELLRELGQGAMGSVYLAKDSALDREVALKVPKIGTIDDSEFMERFRREAQAAANLRHSNICQVIDVNEHRGTPYLTMDFVDGVPLSQLIGSAGLTSVDAVLTMAKRIAEAVQYAHENDVIHRDLKPGNILVDDQLQPHITDFGLARRISKDRDARLTQEGHLLGTPAYMSPEQIRGAQKEISVASDVYSLGAVIYELLTGQLPFEGTVPEIMAQALRDRPLPPGRRRADLSQDVDELCLRMLEKNPEKRFASMKSVAKALDRILHSEHGGKKHSAPAVQPGQTAAEIKRDHIKADLKAGRYASAIQALKELAASKSERDQTLANWARQELPRARSEAKALGKSGIAALFSSATEMFQQHDYQGCIQLLEDVPETRRTEDIEDLLHEATTCQIRVEELLSEIKDLERVGDGARLASPVKELLKLKPGNRTAKRLFEVLQTYQPLRANQRRYRFVRQRLQPMPQSDLFKAWLTKGTLVGLLVFGIVSWGVTIYLKRPGRSDVTVSISDSLLSEGDVELTIDVSEDGDDATQADSTPPVTQHNVDTNFEWTGQIFDDTAMIPAGAYRTHQTLGRFRWCPPGRFLMGSPPEEIGREGNEEQRPVQIASGFWISETEVTQELFASVMSLEPWADFRDSTRGDDIAASHVTWNEAVELAKRLTSAAHREKSVPLDVSIALPSESQWEYACRAGSQTRFCFGDEPDLLGDYAWWRANTDDIGKRHAHSVGQKQPNAWGLHDMHGNVYEWCFDHYVLHHNGSEEAIRLSQDPKTRTNRGGGWARRDENACRSANRRWNGVDDRRNNLGLRLVIVKSSTLPKETPPQKVIPAQSKPAAANSTGGKTTGSETTTPKNSGGPPQLAAGQTWLGTYRQQQPVADHDIRVTLQKKKGTKWYGIFESLRSREVSSGQAVKTGFQFECEFEYTAPGQATLAMTKIVGNKSGLAVRDTTSNWREALTWDGKQFGNQAMKLRLSRTSASVRRTGAKKDLTLPQLNANPSIQLALPTTPEQRSAARRS